MPIYADLTPQEAVAAARRDVAEGQQEAWDALDLYLRWNLLAYLQDRAFEPLDLTEALLDAVDWARQEKCSPWQYHWRYLLEVLDDGEKLPSTAAELRALISPEGQAARFLAFLVESEKPLRPEELGELLEMSQEQVLDLGRRLEQVGLIVHREGKECSGWFLVTPRGLEQASRLPVPEKPDVSGRPEPSSPATAPRWVDFWRASVAVPVDA